jgi:NADH-quinone oxidoreductase subunit B
MGLETKLQSIPAIASKVEFFINWARKWSLFQYPFITACCGMEYMSAACAHFDIDRFGAGWTRFSPRQSDMLLVVGTIAHKEAPVLRTVYEQMTEPKWVISGKFLNRVRQNKGPAWI